VDVRRGVGEDERRGYEDDAGGGAFYYRA